MCNEEAVKCPGGSGPRVCLEDLTCRGLVPAAVLRVPYQATASIRYTELQAAIEWLRDLIGYRFDNGHKIVSIDHFQFIKNGGSWSCVATIRIAE